jgi:hypothetical protein
VGSAGAGSVHAGAFVIVKTQTGGDMIVRTGAELQRVEPLEGTRMSLFNSIIPTGGARTSPGPSSGTPPSPSGCGWRTAASS